MQWFRIQAMIVRTASRELDLHLWKRPRGEDSARQPENLWHIGLGGRAAQIGNLDLHHACNPRRRAAFLRQSDTHVLAWLGQDRLAPGVSDCDGSAIWSGEGDLHGGNPFKVRP
jgi:hypothetical protein